VTLNQLDFKKEAFTRLVQKRIDGAYDGKAGLAALTRYVAAQHGVDGIRCNGISPGFIETRPADGERGRMFRRVIHDHELIARAGRPEDVAEMAVFLAGVESSFVTGQIFGVDGGALAHQAHYADARRAAEGDKS